MTVTLERTLARAKKTPATKYGVAKHYGVFEAPRVGLKLRWDTTDEESVAKVAVAFADAKARGDVLFRTNGADTEQVRVFDMTAEHIVAMPQLQGG